MLSGDTARALSWLLANMTALVDEGGESPIVDSIPLEKIISEPASFSISKGEGEPSTEATPVEEVTEEHPTDEEIWSDWSGWSSCNCGFAYRKRTCISKPNGCQLPEYHKKACKSDVCNPIS
ncbi:unnamed protein product [Auanema sp. JU1783]|nr:unnamed protein product [Auanema sp. JU1783]